MRTLLCVAITVLDEHTALADAAAARDAGADLIEYRIDELFSGATGTDGQLDGRELRSIFRLIAECPLPCIVTCRTAAEGGSYDGDEDARVSLYERLGTAGASAAESKERPPRYIDAEYATYIRSANIRHKLNLAVDHPYHRRDVRTGLVLSMHDFDGRPRDLLRRVSLMQSEPAASVVKVAYTARSIRDNLELFDLLSEGAGGRPLIALGMGRFGLMSRVLAPKFGGFLTFASLRPSSATAPGQPTLSELLDLYRFRAITPKTRVYGVIGWPVEHSLSPAVHNAGFEALWPDTWEEEADASMGTAGTAEQGVQNDRNFEAVYLPLPVPPEWEHFKATLAAIIDHPRLDFGGCSVTLPHKGHLVRFAREAIADGGGGVEWSIDSLSEVCGAANTLVVERGPGGAAVRARVLNTDAMAAVSCLRKALLNGSVPEPADLSGVRVGLLGAGGVARSIAAGLLGAGAAVIVYNRTRANAERLVADLMAGMPERPDSAEIVAAELKDVGRVPCRALVNCTPVGMSGSETPGAKSEESGGTNRAPITLEQLSECSARAGDGKGPGDKPVVFDTVYTPLRTPLLDMAARAGLRTVDGLGMFVLQAAGQFAAWTGRPAPLGLFAQVAREALEERTAG